jgi:hypothetical protein
MIALANNNLRISQFSVFGRIAARKRQGLRSVPEYSANSWFAHLHLAVLVFDKSRLVRQTSKGTAVRDDFHSSFETSSVRRADDVSLGSSSAANQYGGYEQQFAHSKLLLVIGQNCPCRRGSPLLPPVSGSGSDLFSDVNESIKRRCIIGSGQN